MANVTGSALWMAFSCSEQLYALNAKVGASLLGLDTWIGLPNKRLSYSTALFKYTLLGLLTPLGLPVTDKSLSFLSSPSGSSFNIIYENNIALLEGANNRGLYIQNGFSIYWTIPLQIVTFNPKWWFDDRMPRLNPSVDSTVDSNIKPGYYAF